MYELTSNRYQCQAQSKDCINTVESETSKSANDADLRISIRQIEFLIIDARLRKGGKIEKRKLLTLIFFVSQILSTQD